MLSFFKGVFAIVFLLSVFSLVILLSVFSLVFFKGVFSLVFLLSVFFPLGNPLRKSLRETPTQPLTRTQPIHPFVLETRVAVHSFIP